MYAMSQCQGTSWQLGYCIIKSELQVETIQYNIKCYGMLEYIVCQLFIMITILIIMLYWLFSKETFWLVIMSAMYMIVKVVNTYQLTGYNYFKLCVGNLMARMLRWHEIMSSFNCMSSIVVCLFSTQFTASHCMYRLKEWHLRQYTAISLISSLNLIIVTKHSEKFKVLLRLKNSGVFKAVSHIFSVH